MSTEFFDPDELASPAPRTNGELPSSAAGPRPRQPSLDSIYWPDLVKLGQEDPPAQIVAGLLSAGERLMMFGGGGIGKSMLGLELAVSVHRGEPFLDHFKSQKLRVGIVDEESPPRQLGQRLEAITRARGIVFERDDDGDALGLELPIFAVRQGARLDTEEGFRRIFKWVVDEDLHLVIFDTLRRMHRLRENESDDMNQIDASMKRLQAEIDAANSRPPIYSPEDLVPLTIAYVHHSPKPRELGSNDATTMARGSSDLINGVDSALYMRRGPEAGQVICEHAKNRWGSELPPFLVRIETEDGGLRMVYAGGVDEVSGLRDRAVEVLGVALADGPRTRQELVERGKAAGVGTRTVDEALNVLVSGGKATRGRSGRAAIYTLTTGGLLA